MTFKARLLLAVICSGALGVARAAAPRAIPGAVDLGPNVLVLDPGSPDAQTRVSRLFAEQEKAQFTDRRVAILLKPGRHDLDLRVGFYTQVMGLGRRPDDVDVRGAVRCTAEWMKGNATCNFWRAAENLSVTPTGDRRTNVWAVSQATALRRVHIKGNLALWDGGWSSGGFLADCAVDGDVVSGSQQQWISRNCDWARWHGGNFNMVFVGVPHAPEGTWPDKAFTAVPVTPLVREKPYLRLGDGGRYEVVVPVLKRDSSGPTPDAAADPAIGLDAFHVARPDRDNARTLNAALADGRHLLLTPGIYELSESLRVTRPGTIVLGLGYATLKPVNGTAAVAVDDVDGVTLAGLLLDAGPVESPTLLEVGTPGATASHARNPTALFDIYARAGGAAVGRTRSFVNVHSRDVIGDNFWLWRADHGRGVSWDGNAVANGLVVHGDDVTVYGLFVEHTQGYQTLWNGNGGRVYFYQSEFPYDPPSQTAWGNDGRGYASYKVADHVRTHEAHGLGVYCVFTHAAVVADTAIETPIAPGVRLRNMVTVRFGGKPGSGVAHVINGQGADAISGRTTRVP